MQCRGLSGECLFYRQADDMCRFALSKPRRVAPQRVGASQSSGRRDKPWTVSHGNASWCCASFRTCSASCSCCHWRPRLVRRFVSPTTSAGFDSAMWCIAGGLVVGWCVRARRRSCDVRLGMVLKQVFSGARFMGIFGRIRVTETGHQQVPSRLIPTPRPDAPAARAAHALRTARRRDIALARD